MILNLYNPAEEAFDSNGIGPLSDIISARVAREVNGTDELEIRYPLLGRHAAEISDRCLILAAPDPITQPQPYRIYRRVPASGGTIAVYARHWAYDLAGITVDPMTAHSVAEVMAILPDKTTTPCPFQFETDKDVGSLFSYPKPRNLWRTLGGSEGSILDVYGGEYDFDRRKIRLLKRRGANRGVEIRYGKNLRTVEMDRNCAEVYTGAHPYWDSEEHGLVTLPDMIIPAEGTYDFVRIYELDLSGDFQEPPTPEELESRARAWMKSNHIGEPKISWKIEFTQLEQTEEYKGKALLEQIMLGDTTHAIFTAMGVDVEARAVATDYDPVHERYNSVTLGRVRQNLADTIIHQNDEISKKPGKGEVGSLVTAISQKLGAALTGALGGAVRVLDTDGDGMPDELYIADNPTPAQAKKVWRFNYEGWAASKSGYNGPYEFGATLEDGLLAAAVTAAHLKAGTIESRDGSFFADLDNNIFRFKMVSDLEADVEDKYQTIVKILRMTPDGLLLGEDGSDTQLLLDNDAIKILVAGFAEMIINHSGLFADQATIRQLHMGGFSASVSGEHGQIWTLTYSRGGQQ